MVEGENEVGDEAATDPETKEANRAESNRGAGVTALESWLKRMVKLAVGEMRESCEPDWSDTCARTREERNRYHDSYHDDWSKTEQRIAILLLQTRALENRQLAGMLAAQPPPNVDPASALKISMACNDRSRKLEALATELAKNWPPEWWSEIVRVQ